MSRKSRKSANHRRTTRKPRLDRPFAPALLKRARAIAYQYRIVLEQVPEVGYLGSAVELPTVFADGPTADACIGSTREALTVAVAAMFEMGRRPPSPASTQRDAQINIRVSTEERLAIENAAHQQGFRGVSDFVRAAALDRAK